MPLDGADQDVGSLPMCNAASQPICNAVNNYAQDKQLTEKQRNHMLRVFQKFDHDQSGEISLDELTKIIETLGVKLQEKDLQRIHRKYDRDGNGTVTFEEFLSFASLRIIQSVGHAAIVDTKKTVAALLVGKNSSLERWIFFTVVSQKGICGKMLWIMWYTGLFLGLISQQTLILAWNPWRSLFNTCTVLMLPLPCFAILVLSVDLIKELMYQGEMWTILCLQLCWTLGSVRLLRDARCLFWLCLIPSIIVSAISDSYPAKFRPHFQKMFFSGLLLAMMWWCLIVTFSWNEPMVDPVWQVKRLRFSAATGSVADVATAIIFALRSLWAAFMTPDEFVVIVNQTRTTHVLVENAATPRPTGETAATPRATFNSTKNGSHAAMPCATVDAPGSNATTPRRNADSCKVGAHKVAIMDQEDSNVIDVEKLVLLKRNGELQEELEIMRDRLRQLQSQEQESMPWRSLRLDGPCLKLCIAQQPSSCHAIANGGHVQERDHVLDV